MHNKTFIKILKQVRDEPGLLEEFEYICNAAKSLIGHSPSNSSRHKGFESKMQLNSPRTGGAFTRNKYWISNLNAKTGLAWWSTVKASIDDNTELLMKEKRRWITHTIKQLSK